MASSWCATCREDYRGLMGWCIYCQREFKHLHGHIQRQHAGTIRAEACPVKTYEEWLAQRK